MAEREQKIEVRPANGAAAIQAEDYGLINNLNWRGEKRQRQSQSGLNAARRARRRNLMPGGVNRLALKQCGLARMRPGARPGRMAPANNAAGCRPGCPGNVLTNACRTPMPDGARPRPNARPDRPARTSNGGTRWP